MEGESKRDFVRNREIERFRALVKIGRVRSAFS